MVYYKNRIYDFKEDTKTIHVFNRSTGKRLHIITCIAELCGASIGAGMKLKILNQLLKWHGGQLTRELLQSIS